MRPDLGRAHAIMPFVGETAVRAQRIVRLSKKGIDLIRSAFKEDMAHEARLIDCLTDEEQRTLSALLGKLTKALEGSEGGRKS